MRIVESLYCQFTLFPYCSGLKVLGVRDLTYRLAFLACSIVPSDAKVSY